MEFRAINKIGLELEGAWTRLFPDVEIEADVSVKRPPSIHPGPNAHWGEIKSTPLPSLAEGEKFIRDHIPEAVFNGQAEGHYYSTGYHIHVSVRKARDFARLASRRFWEEFHEKAADWGLRVEIPPEDLFWSRLQGSNRFCKKVYAPSRQIGLLEKRDDRRTTINYCWEMHGTVEFRLFPMWTNPDYAVAALRFVVETIEDFLAEPYREKTRSGIIRVKTTRAPSRQFI